MGMPRGKTMQGRAGIGQKTWSHLCLLPPQRWEQAHADDATDPGRMMPCSFGTDLGTGSAALKANYARGRGPAAHAWCGSTPTTLQRLDTILDGFLPLAAPPPWPGRRKESNR